MEHTSSPSPLRERPPVRIDRVVFQREGMDLLVIEAEAAPAVRPNDPIRRPSRHCTSTPPATWACRVTNHVRQGILCPSRFLHQRRRRP